MDGLIECRGECKNVHIGLQSFVSEKALSTSSFHSRVLSRRSAGDKPCPERLYLEPPFPCSATQQMSFLLSCELFSAILSLSKFGPTLPESYSARCAANLGHLLLAQPLLIHLCARLRRDYQAVPSSAEKGSTTRSRRDAHPKWAWRGCGYGESERHMMMRNRTDNR